MIKYSIITPMYNSFSLMERYFDSLKNQTFKDFEVIIVDDSSTDDSFQQAKNYAAGSELSITVLKTEQNAGPGNARNIGMDAARGEWITFVDNDDWVEYTILEEIDKAVSQNNTNCVIYDYYTTDGENASVARSMYCGEEGTVSMSDCMKFVRNHSIGKFYKRVNCREANIRFPEFRRCEDVAFVIRAIDACGSAYYLKKPFYYYYQRPSSLSNNAKLDHMDMVKAFTVLEESLGNKYPEELKEKSVTDILYGALLMMCKAGKSKKEIKEYIEAYEKKYPEWWKCQIINHLGRAKRMFLKAAKMRMIFAMKQYAKLQDYIIARGSKKN